MPASAKRRTKAFPKSRPGTHHNGDCSLGHRSLPLPTTARSFVGFDVANEARDIVGDKPANGSAGIHCGENLAAWIQDETGGLQVARTVIGVCTGGRGDFVRIRAVSDRKSKAVLFDKGRGGRLVIDRQATTLTPSSASFGRRAKMPRAARCNMGTRNRGRTARLRKTPQDRRARRSCRRRRRQSRERGRCRRWEAQASDSPIGLISPICLRKRRLSTTICIMGSIGSDRPPTARGTATRARIVEAAADLVRAHGVANTSLDAVLAASDASKSQLYHYFADKDDLVLAVIQRQTECVLPRRNYFCAELRRLPDCAAGGMRGRVVAEDPRAGGCPLGSLVSELAELARPRVLLAEGFGRWEALSRRRVRGDTRPRSKQGGARPDRPCHRRAGRAARRPAARPDHALDAAARTRARHKPWVRCHYSEVCDTAVTS